MSMRDSKDQEDFLGAKLKFRCCRKLLCYERGGNRDPSPMKLSCGALRFEPRFDSFTHGERTLVQNHFGSI